MCIYVHIFQLHSLRGPKSYDTAMAMIIPGVRHRFLNITLPKVLLGSRADSRFGIGNVHDEPGPSYLY